MFGPNEYFKDDMRSMVLKAYQQIKENGKVRLFKSYVPEYGDGEQKRDFIYIKDCVNTMWWFLQNPQVAGIYNLGTGKARTWRDLVQAVFAALNKNSNIEFIDMPENIRGQYQYFTEADMRKLRAVYPEYNCASLEDSIRDYVINYLEPGLISY